MFYHSAYFFWSPNFAVYVFVWHVNVSIWGKYYVNVNIGISETEAIRPGACIHTCGWIRYELSDSKYMLIKFVSGPF